MIRSLTALALCAIPALLAGPARAQEQRLQVVVVYIAGANVYIDAGTERGISEGDTLDVFSDPAGNRLGAFQVVSSTRERAVLAFAGRPFAVTRGVTLQVVPRTPLRASPAARTTHTARAILHPENGSEIQAWFTISDDGRRLAVTGTATGLRPGSLYTSFLYGGNTVARGPNACTAESGGLSLGLGRWNVDVAGNGTLTTTLTGDKYVPISEIGTVSVRDVSLAFELVACGEAVTQRAPRTAAAGQPSGGRASRSASRSTNLSGRLSVDINVLESTTQLGETQPPIERLYTTPSVRLRTTVNELPWGFDFTTNLRATSFMSNNEAVQPTQSLRVYQASIGKSFRSVPLQFQLGRFYNPYETFSGYWDGLVVHVGRSGLGAGFAVGFQPNRGNEDFSTDLPKYGAFIDYQYSGGSVRYYADLSYNELRPSNGLLGHRFVGLSQRFQWNRFGLSQRLRVDRNAGTDKWELTQLEVRTTLPLGRRLTALVGYSYWRSLFFLGTTTPEVTELAATAYERERGSFGLSYSMWSGTIGADVTMNRLEGDEISYTYGSHFSFPRTPLLGFGLFGSANYWERGTAKTLYLTPGITRSFGRLESRLSYSRYSFTNGPSTLITHTFDMSLTFPVTRRWYLLVQGRAQRSPTLNSNSVYSGLWLSF
jgi:hypothetical protein